MSTKKRYNIGLMTYDVDKYNSVKNILDEIVKLDKNFEDNQEGKYDLILFLCEAHKKGLIDPKELNKDNYSDKVIEGFWIEFGAIGIDSDKCIENDFRGFDIGTYQKDVWSWFDEQHSKGIKYLMYGV